VGKSWRKTFYSSTASPCELFDEFPIPIIVRAFFIHTQFYDDEMLLSFLSSFFKDGERNLFFESSKKQKKEKRKSQESLSQFMFFTVQPLQAIIQ
jgi:hypothetical protein